LAALVILPAIVWQVMRPLPLEFTWRRGRFHLVIAESVLAREVAALNPPPGEPDGPRPLPPD
jgi:hypothetical protein